MELKPGTRLRSVACTTEVVVVRAPADALDLRCGGHPLAEAGTDGSAELVADFDGGTLLGKRYSDEAGTVELLCTKAGAGSLAIGDTPLTQAGAKPLPASD
jgi:hypothetical protein